MTAKKPFREKLIAARQSKSFDSDCISRLLDILCNAGQNGLTIYEINDKYDSSVARNTITNYLGILQNFLGSLSKENSGSLGIEQFKKEGQRATYYRISNISQLQSLLRPGNNFEYLSSRLVSFSVPKPPQNHQRSSPHSAVQLSDEDYLFLSHRFAVDIAIREIGYPVEILSGIEHRDEFNSLIEYLETSGRAVYFHQPVRVSYRDSNGRYAVTLAPLSLERRSNTKTIHLTGICIESTKNGQIYLASLSKTGTCRIDFFDSKKDVISVPLRSIESITPVYVRNKRAVFTADKAEQSVSTDYDDGDLMNLCGRPFEIYVFDLLLDAEKEFNSRQINDWMVGFSTDNTKDEVLSWLREEGLLEEDESGYIIPTGLEDYFIYPERKVQCINYLKLLELFLHFDLEPKAESLPEFLKHTLKRKAIGYLRQNEPDTTTDYQRLLTESEVYLPYSENSAQTRLNDCWLSSFRRIKEIDFIGNTLGYRDANCLNNLNLFFHNIYGINDNPQGEKYLSPVYTVVEVSADKSVALIPLAVNTAENSIVLTCLNADLLIGERTEKPEDTDSIYSQIILALTGVNNSSEVKSLLYTIPIQVAYSSGDRYYCSSAEVKNRLQQTVSAFKERYGIYCSPLFDSLIQQKRCYRVKLRSESLGSARVLIPDCFDLITKDKKEKNAKEQHSSVSVADALQFETSEHRLVLEFLQKYAELLKISEDDSNTRADLRRLIQRQYRFITE